MILIFPPMILIKDFYLPLNQKKYVKYYYNYYNYCNCLDYEYYGCNCSNLHDTESTIKCDHHQLLCNWCKGYERTYSSRNEHDNN